MEFDKMAEQNPGKVRPKVIFFKSVHPPSKTPPHAKPVVVPAANLQTLMRATKTLQTPDEEPIIALPIVSQKFYMFPFWDILQTTKNIHPLQSVNARYRKQQKETVTMHSEFLNETKTDSIFISFSYNG